MEKIKLISGNWTVLNHDQIRAIAMDCPAAIEKFRLGEDVLMKNEPRADKGRYWVGVRDTTHTHDDDVYGIVLAALGPDTVANCIEIVEEGDQEYIDPITAAWEDAGVRIRDFLWSSRN